MLQELSETNPVGLLFVIIIFLLVLVAINYLVLEFRLTYKFNKLREKIQLLEKQLSEKEKTQSEDYENSEN